VGQIAQAQSEQDENSDIQFTELELEKNIPKNEEPEVSVRPVLSKQTDAVKLEPAKLNPDGNQVVVIQKNYMPKTGRFALNGGLTLFPSDVFFKTYGGQVRGSYFFNETWGFELSGIFLTSSKSTELKDLENKQSVTVSNLATLKSYLGGQIYFSSMYGKYALNDRKIFPFEIYQTVGAGQMTTDKGSSPALSLGFGQMISLSRDSALRWDLSFQFYQTENVSGTKTNQNSLLINFSYSAFFPSVGRRW
jgi:outer membrane beta-barrel protein